MTSTIPINSEKILCVYSEIRSESIKDPFDGRLVPTFRYDRISSFAVRNVYQNP